MTWTRTCLALMTLLLLGTFRAEAAGNESGTYERHDANGALTGETWTLERKDDNGGTITSSTGGHGGYTLPAKGPCIMVLFFGKDGKSHWYQLCPTTSPGVYTLHDLIRTQGTIMVFDPRPSGFLSPGRTP